jgi:hypothetical protein
MNPQKPTLQKTSTKPIPPALTIGNIPIAPTGSLRQIEIPFRSQKLTTPQVYRAAMYSIIGSAVLLTGAIANAVMSQRSALYTVGFETTPSIYQAQRIRDSVADMDANVANLLLVPTGQNPDAEKAYQERKQKLSALLTRAAQNITIPLEQTLIIDLSLNINNYIEKTQEAKVLHSQGKTEEAIKVYRDAQKLVDGILMVKANELDQVNFEALRKGYDEGRSRGAINQLIICLLGALLVGSLIWIQLILTRWAKRRFNVGLLLATIVSSIFVLDTLIRLTTTSDLLKIAKEDAFDSLHALRKSRSIAYSLNADESRYLLDSNFSSVHRDNFFGKVRSLVTFKNQNLRPEQDSTKYSQAIRQLLQNSSVNQVSDLEGSFAEQLKNITFRGESEATQTMVQSFLNYFDIDQKIRTLYTTGNKSEAIKLCIGKSNDAFNIFLKAHSDVMDININAFDNAIYTGLSKLDVSGVDKKILAVDSAPNGQNKGLDIFWIKAFLVTGTIVGLTIYGLRSRIIEYEI